MARKANEADNANLPANQKPLRDAPGDAVELFGKVLGNTDAQNDALANDPTEMAKFCKILTYGGISEEIEGNGVAVDAAAAANGRRLLQYQRELYGLHVSRSLQAASSNLYFVQDDAGADLTSYNTASGLTEADFDESGKILAVMAVFVSTFFTLLF